MFCIYRLLKLCTLHTIVFVTQFQEVIPSKIFTICIRIYHQISIVVNIYILKLAIYGNKSLLNIVNNNYKISLCLKSYLNTNICASSLILFIASKKQGCVKRVIFLRNFEIGLVTKFILMIFLRRVLIVLFLLIRTLSWSQDCTSCGGVVTINVDLSANPDTVWITPTELSRTGQCCHGTGSDDCIRFNITTHPRAGRLGFTLADGAIPPSMEYALNCGTPISVNDTLCIAGAGPHCIVYCKPGTNAQKYQISVSPAASASPDITIGDGCSDTISVDGLIESSVRWDVIYPSTADNTYLSCISGCSQTIVSPPNAIFPPYIDVQVAGEYLSGCGSTSATIIDTIDTIRVHIVSDKEVNISPANPNICFGGTSVTLTAESTGGLDPLEYLWSTGETTQSIEVSTVGEYSVIVTDMTDCPPVYDTVIVTEHLSPITVEVGDANVCTSTSQVNLSAIVTVADGVQWSGGSGTFFPDDTDLNPTYTLSATEIANMGTTLYVETTGNDSCPPAYDTLTITLSPQPFVDAGTDGIVCQTTLQIPLSGQVVGDSNDGVWSTMGTGTFSNANDLNATYYPSPADTALGYVNLILSSIANGVCTPVRDTVTIEFGNLPSPDFTFTQPACAGEPINFTDNTTVTWGVVQTYDWDFGGISTSSVRNPSYAFSTPGTYSVTLRTVTDQGCANEITKQVLVSTDPVANFTYTPTCFGTGVAFQNTSVDDVSWFWDFGNGFVSTQENPSGILYNSDGTFNVTLVAMNAEGCGDTVTNPIDVLPRPIADFQVDNICAGTDVTFTDNSTISTGSIISWFWDFGGTTSTVQNPTQSFSTTNPINVKLRVESAYCSDSIVRQVTPLETPSFFATPTSGCAPLNVSFYNTVQPNVYYDWDFGDGYTSTMANPTHLFLNTTNDPVSFDVVLHARSIFGCHDSVISEILVYPQSISDFSVSSQTICSDQEVSFTNQSVNAVNYFWDFGPDYGIVAAENPSQVFTNNTTTTQYLPVRLITSSSYGCADTAIQYITTYPLPDNSISLNADRGCHPLSVTMTAQSGAQTYTWDYDDGTVEIGSHEMIHVFENVSSLDRVFNVSLEVTSTNNCISIIDTTVTVSPSPIAEFSLSAHEGCAPLPVQILNTSQGAISYAWTYGDGNTGTQAVSLQDYTYTNTSTSQQSYPVTLEVTSSNGCTDMYSESVLIYPMVEASFTTPITENCSPFNLIFQNTSTGADSYVWKADGDNFSTNANASNSFINDVASPLNYDIQLVATSIFGCRDESDITTITVNPRPVSDFEIPLSSGCSPFDLPINNNTTGATSYSWEFSSGFTTTGDLTSHTFSNTSQDIERVTMKLIANNSYICPDTTIQTVTVFPEVTAQFNANPTVGCSPLEVDFQNYSSANATRFLWEFGDGEEATISSPSHTFDNSATVTFTAISNYTCEDSETINITVYQTPAADFELSSNYLQLPEKTVTIQNITSGDWTFNWNFGDGATLNNVRDPQPHTFPGTGEYQIILTAIGNNGCEDTVSHTVVIIEAAIVADYDTSFSGCAPVEATFTNKSENASWYLWDFGDGTTSTEINPTHTYEEPGTFIVELRAGNENSSRTSRKHTVEVYPNPTADFTVAPAEVYLPNAQVSFYNQADEGFEYRWYFGDGQRDTAYETSYLYSQEGVYDVALYVTTDKGCSDSVLQEGAVTVKLKCEMLFPNAFTPSESEISGVYLPDVPEINNDIFHPVYENVEDYNLQIFNRWGELIFESNDINEGWNGYYKGTLSKQDSYVWQVEATCFGGRKILKSGSVTLIR